MPISDILEGYAVYMGESINPIRKKVSIRIYNTGERSASETVIPGTWVAPSAQWAMAYALCAFLRPNLHLSNPGVMTSLFPPFWNMYNTLPVPVLKRKLEKEDEDAKPARRRVIARGVYGELPPEPAAGEDF